jgi:hypothetical protein
LGFSGAIDDTTGYQRGHQGDEEVMKWGGL